MTKVWRVVLAIVVAAALAAGATMLIEPGGTPPRGDAATTRAREWRARFPGWTTDFTRARVPLSDFQDGGPPRDGIPPIDRPQLVGVSAADAFLDDREPVIVVEAGDLARAYPIQILVWHEIVNDTLAGRPIAVTYCPLCNSALVFDRRVGGRTLDFGTTGKLRRSDLVMWDRQTQSWWQQFDGKALVGTLAGSRLHPVASQILSWGDFRERHPAGRVLSRDTGHDREYGRSPYPGYETPGERPFLYDGRLDARLPPKERVVLVSRAERSIVVPFSRLRRRPVIAGTIGGAPFVTFFKRGVASALDGESIAGSRDVGTAGVFDPRAGGRKLTFVSTGGGRFRDRQTSSAWDITGRAVSGPLRGRRLRVLRHDEQFWFAVAAFVPRARIVG